MSLRTARRSTVKNSAIGIEQLYFLFPSEVDYSYYTISRSNRASNVFRVRLLYQLTRKKICRSKISLNSIKKIYFYSIKSIRKCQAWVAFFDASVQIAVPVKAMELGGLELDPFFTWNFLVKTFFFSKTGKHIFYRKLTRENSTLLVLEFKGASLDIFSDV